MTQRFGGKFSPGGITGNSDRGPVMETRHRLQGRPKWITIAATPLLLGAFFQDPTGLVANLAGFGLIAAGMWMTGEGLKAEAAYDRRRVARRPAIPRKLFGGAIAALGLGVGAFEPGALVGSGLIGAAGLGLHWLAFGADPMRNKGMAGIDSFQQDRAARMIAEGQAHLDQMKDAIRRSGERRLEARVSIFEATVQELFDQVREDPANLGAVRRYMGVYLMGARDATIKFADLYARSQDASARTAYEQFLTDLENDFSARSKQLLEGDRTDMDIEISVLRDRLAREGVHPADPPDDGDDRLALGSEDAQTLDELLTMPEQEKTRR